MMRELKGPREAIGKTDDGASVDICVSVVIRPSSSRLLATVPTLASPNTLW